MQQGGIKTNKFDLAGGGADFQNSIFSIRGMGIFSKISEAQSKI